MMGLGVGLAATRGGTAPDSTRRRPPRPSAKRPRSRSTSRSELPVPVSDSQGACSSDCTRSRTNDSRRKATRSGRPSPAQTHTDRSRSVRFHRTRVSHPSFRSRSTVAPTARHPAPPPRGSAAGRPRFASHPPSPGHPAPSPGDNTSDRPPVQWSKNARGTPDRACRGSPQCRPAPGDRRLGV